MQAIRRRQAEKGDVTSMAAIRAREWNSEDFWKARIAVIWQAPTHPSRLCRRERCTSPRTQTTLSDLLQGI